MTTGMGCVTYTTVRENAADEKARVAAATADILIRRMFMFTFGLRIHWLAVCVFALARRSADGLTACCRWSGLFERLWRRRVERYATVSRKWSDKLLDR